jgi:hypothetical protein
MDRVGGHSYAVGRVARTGKRAERQSKTTTTPTVPPNLLSFGDRHASLLDRAAEAGRPPASQSAGRMSSKRRKASASAKRSNLIYPAISMGWRDRSGLTPRVDHSPSRVTYPQGFEITCGFGNGRDRIAADARGMRISGRSIAETRTALGSARSRRIIFVSFARTLPSMRETPLSHSWIREWNGRDRTCHVAAIELDYPGAGR